MLLKDLKLGINAKGINKVWKDLIPQFNVMLADKYFEKQQKVKNKEFIITQKLDGCRFILIKDENSQVKYFTRQGQEIDGLVEFENDIAKIPFNTVIDGELLLNKEGLHSKDLYRETMKESRKKGIKHGLVLHAFDILTFTEFKQGISKTKCKDRKEILHKLIQESNFTNIVEVPSRYVGKDESMIIKLLDEAIANSEEGVMVNLSNAPYECKRTSNILKVKKFQDADLKVLDIIEGTGKNVGKLGAITVQFEVEGKLYTCDCGSGFSDEERELYWKNKELLLGKIVTIGYFEISQNSKTKEYGLRFPTWKSIIRHDKTEISMY
jgi:DNA ligase-1